MLCYLRSILLLLLDLLLLLSDYLIIKKLLILSKTGCISRSKLPMTAFLLFLHLTYGRIGSRN